MINFWNLRKQRGMKTRLDRNQLTTHRKLLTADGSRTTMRSCRRWTGRLIERKQRWVDDEFLESYVSNVGWKLVSRLTRDRKFVAGDDLMWSMEKLFDVEMWEWKWEVKRDTCDVLNWRSDLNSEMMCCHLMFSGWKRKWKVWVNIFEGRGRL